MKNNNGSSVSHLAASLPVNGNSGTHKARIGILEWFHFKDYAHVNTAIKQLNELNIKELRTGFSWADYHREDGPEWFDWYVPELSKHVNLLPCFLYTPPSIGIEPKTSSPPKEVMEFGFFISEMLEKYGRHFEYVELWNEPNNQSEYDFTLDKSWMHFAKMIHFAAHRVKMAGKKTVLGGMSPIDANWLQIMIELGTLRQIDVVGIHGFPGVYHNHWQGWENQINKIKKVLEDNGLGHIEIWITEAGYSTKLYDERQQLKEFLNLIDVKVPRVYWYSLNDLEARHPTVDGFHLDEREYSFGLAGRNNRPKLLYKLLKERGLQNIHREEWMSSPYSTDVKKTIEDQKHFLITGGAGFIGANLATHLLKLGHTVTIYDNLSRAGVEKNIRWLKGNFQKNLNIHIDDVRNPYLLEKVVKDADMVYHFAAQVAVTTSFEDPEEDFDINARGTLNLLNALRKLSPPPPLLFTSTNKVYGRMNSVKLKLVNDQYAPAEAEFLQNGINESMSLDFCSPYGCSKGTADQYVLDHAREWGLKAVVFRMSCIYGPHQCGTEDQGWVAHFIMSALKDKAINIYGDGKQVRDILYIDDLIRAFILAYNKMDLISGEAFNIGGGIANGASLNEVINIIGELVENPLAINAEQWRPGDQRYYISDIRKFNSLTGWFPKTTKRDGIMLLCNWLIDNLNLKDKQLQFQTTLI